MEIQLNKLCTEKKLYLTTVNMKTEKVFSTNIKAFLVTY